MISIMFIIISKPEYAKFYNFEIKNCKRWISLNTVVRILETFYKITTVCFNVLAQLYIIILGSYVSKKNFKKGK